MLKLDQSYFFSNSELFFEFNDYNYFLCMNFSEDVRYPHVLSPYRISYVSLVQFFRLQLLLSSFLLPQIDYHLSLENTRNFHLKEAERELVF